MRTAFKTMFAAMLFVPSLAFAANLSVYPASISLKKGDSIGFIVRVQSEDSINTVGASLLLPNDLAFLSASDGPLLTQWVEHPTFNAKDQSVSFGGIVPNGWRGEGEVAVIKVAAKEDGVYSLQFDKSQTEIYKNDGNATPEPVVYGAAIVPLWAPEASVIIGLILVVLVLIAMWLRRKYKISFV